MICSTDDAPLQNCVIAGAPADASAYLVGEERRGHLRHWTDIHVHAGAGTEAALWTGG